MNLFDDYRNEIDAIDDNLVKLLIRRMEIAEEIGRIKDANGLSTRDPKREKLILQRIAGKVDSDAYRDKILLIMRTILESSRALQNSGRRADHVIRPVTEEMVTVGYSGIPGSYGENAVHRFFGDNGGRIRNYGHFAEVCDAVLSGDIRYGVLPAENTTTGAIKEVYDLIREKELYITGEVCVPIVHHLIGKAGTALEDIREVYSHPQGLEQCAGFLEGLSARQIPMKNTAVSVRHVAEMDSSHAAAIGGERAAHLYGLEILKPAVQNSLVNTTRFVVLSKLPEVTEDADSSSMVLTAKHASGSLYDILGCFAREQVNLFRIESRPVPDRPWEYYIYLDAEGSIETEPVQRTLDAVKDICSYFRFLGSYRKGISY